MGKAGLNLGILFLG